MQVRLRLDKGNAFEGKLEVGPNAAQTGPDKIVQLRCVRTPTP
jgi:hypothetical protein